MTQQKARKNRIRGWIEGILLTAGLVGLGLWGASNLFPIVWQDWGNWVFDHQRRGETATVGGYLTGKLDQITGDVEAWFGWTPVAKVDIPPGAPHSAEPEPPLNVPQAERPPLAENDLIGRLTIPRLRLSAIVREGVGKDTLGLAVGHIPGTSLPGQNGNVAVAGHRDTLFLGLKGIQANDVVKFETLNGSYTYEVKSTEIVRPQDVSVLNASRYSELTLVTCYPFSYIGSAPYRFIVKAREVSEHPPRHIEIVREGVREDSLKAVSVPEASHFAARTGTTSGTTPGAVPGTARGTTKVSFDVVRNHSRTLAPGISIGIDGTDASGQRVNGWMWIMPDRRTIWLRDQRTQDPVIFYGHEDGKKRELLITQVTDSSASGYLLMPER